MLPEVVVFWDRDFEGPSWRENLDVHYVGDDWNDQISSIIVISGTWAFFEHKEFNRDTPGTHIELTPGYYSFVEFLGMANDSISSFRPISSEPQGGWPAPSV